MTSVLQHSGVETGSEAGMDWDDVRPIAPAALGAIGQDLSALGIAELEQRIGALKNEIARVEQELARKRAHEAAASALFKS